MPHTSGLVQNLAKFSQWLLNSSNQIIHLIIHEVWKKYFLWRVSCWISFSCFSFSFQNHDYVILNGARRKEQRWDPKENEQIVPEGMFYLFTHYVHPLGRAYKMLTVLLQKGKTLNHPKKQGVLGMTLYCIWWWGFTSGQYERPFHCHYSQVHIIQSCSIMSQINLFENYLYLIGILDAI